MARNRVYNNVKIGRFFLFAHALLNPGDLSNMRGGVKRPDSSLQRVIRNELPAALDVFAHQDAEHVLGFAGFLQGDAKQQPL